MTEQDEKPLVFLPLNEVIRRTGVSRSSIYRLCDENQFPKPVALTKARIAFVEAEVIEWQKERLRAREAAGGR